MINMLVGQPGGGKSYEAVAYHVLPALQQGRKVVTNLPLDIEAFRRLDAGFPALIDVRQNVVEEVVEKKTWNIRWRSFDVFNVKTSHRPFASIADYGDEWRHPETGGGVLYVIDECHLSLPRARPGTTKEVEEWFSLHRHELADVLLITQSYGKVCKAICDMVQVLYRVKKATAFGTNNKYIRKVQDGIGGEVVNTGIRDYQKKFFSLYKSHTKSSSAGQELAANDIVPFWKRWPIIGAGLCFLTVAVMLLTGTSANPLTQAQAQVVEMQAKRAREAASGVPVAPASAPHTLAAPSAPVSGVSAVPADAPIPELLPEPSGGTRSQSTGGIAAHPFDGLRLHIVAFLQSGDRWLYVFEADQNGQPVAMLTQKQLEESGYKIEKMSTCSARVIYGALSFFAVCDSPRISVVRTSS